MSGEKRGRPRSPFRCDETECRQQARWFVVSGPMLVCWQHKIRYEAQGETCAALGGGFA